MTKSEHQQIVTSACTKLSLLAVAGYVLSTSAWVESRPVPFTLLRFVAPMATFATIILVYMVYHRRISRIQLTRMLFAIVVSGVLALSVLVVVVTGSRF